MDEQLSEMLKLSLKMGTAQLQQLDYTRQILQSVKSLERNTCR